MRNILIIQAILVLVGVVVSRFYLGDAAVLPALYGGSIALVNTLLLQRRAGQVEQIAKENPHQSVVSVYIGVIQRFVLVLVALGVGLGVLFKPQVAAHQQIAVALVGTFIVAQLGFILTGSRYNG